MRFCSLALTFVVSTYALAQVPAQTATHAAVYITSPGIEYAYDERGAYKARRLEVIAELTERQFKECGKDKRNSLSFNYYRPTPTQAKARNQVLSELRFYGYAMDISVRFDETNKACTDFVDALHTSYSENMRVARGYSPIDYNAQRIIQVRNDACSSGKDSCTKDINSYHCKYKVGSEHLLRNKNGELKGFIMSRPSSAVSTVCFFDRVGQALSVMPIFNDAIEDAINR